MDILTGLDRKADYSTGQLQLIMGAWVLSALVDRKEKVAVADGHVEDEDYNKQSIYALLYSLYRSVGVCQAPGGEPFELTFNTWGYAWPEGWGPASCRPTDPQKFGKNAYAGLYAVDQVREYVAARNGKVHVVEMGCGTGAGAHHVCKNVLPDCTYEAVDMQNVAIQTCRRKFVPELGGRLVATCSDCTDMAIKDGVADIVAVCETHVTEQTGVVTPEDQAFFRAAHRILKPGGLMVWGNVIPNATWQPCFDFLASIGMKLVVARDVTQEAIAARDQDAGRVQAYVDHALGRFPAFRIPVLGRRRRREADGAMKNFYRNPGTKMYVNMKNGTDTYKVVLLQKAE